MKNKILLFLILVSILPFLIGFMGNWTRLMKSGYEAYSYQDYAEAVEAYQEAVLQKPNNPIAHHNLGTALYKNGKYRQAAYAFQTSLLKPNVPNRAAVYYNLGNAQFKMQDLQAAVKSYQLSLRLNPNDPDTKHNLALAQKLLSAEKPNITQQQKDSRQKQDSTKTEPNNLTKAETDQLLEKLSKNESKRRQNILKQKLFLGISMIIT